MPFNCSFSTRYDSKSIFIDDLKKKKVIAGAGQMPRGQGQWLAHKRGWSVAPPMGRQHERTCFALLCFGWSKIPVYKDASLPSYREKKKDVYKQHECEIASVDLPIYHNDKHDNKRPRWRVHPDFILFKDTLKYQCRLQALINTFLIITQVLCNSLVGEADSDSALGLFFIGMQQWRT